MKTALLLMLIFSMLATVPAMAKDKPGEGVTVKPARATWNTGFFQEALVRRALTELGYKAKKPKDLTNPIFYKSVSLGDMDYWTNGWFPMHNAQMPKDWQKTVAKVGYVVKAGGLQGYLVSKKAAEKFNIKSLDDFKRPEVVKAFDANGDGKADLTACPPGWGCEKAIRFHLDTYKLRKYIKPIKASYAAGMAAAMGRYKNGKPIFFYTWTPNWTVYMLKPGQDVVWINVPKIVPSKAQMDAVDRMTVSGIKGAVSDPVKLGFVASDIRIVANKKFLAKNPAAKKFFEVFTLPLEDINEQNTRMNKGEKSQKDIERHVDEWIAKNQDKWNKWLDAARKAAK
ncbi:MAG: glycine betaine/L-proline ABC transporter substrate-binding protein ProX [Desulfarculaceae bacterium]|nr:glycine betaine/L-proline ABC transporter substrate-binding protein ProX [Desulfarculaceae bacterium]MCF8049190.1 glycine betaine/L-proline ABC transporter substrate-binding protein ProX [Desulfarculaceae bacterium]MCF8064661.1 glycine betaine/L-proline ABC transporter substrate-binding protein ProX [Desulfarculaceae bacterium]MCF8100003.1 glycine betaine/L-proline ABC transporter substrate-binding protein ProX [Desulfarculaceae bacterium]MCF8124586.1 glycine betaine/L-proline ABC transporte